MINSFVYNKYENGAVTPKYESIYMEEGEHIIQAIKGYSIVLVGADSDADDFVDEWENAELITAYQDEGTSAYILIVKITGNNAYICG